MVAKYGLLLAVLFAGGFAFPTYEENVPAYKEESSDFQDDALNFQENVAAFEEDSAFQEDAPAFEEDTVFQEDAPAFEEDTVLQEDAPAFEEDTVFQEAVPAFDDDAAFQEESSDFDEEAQDEVLEEDLNDIEEDITPGFDEDMAKFFDHTVSDAQGRIVGGTTAPAGSWPWMVALRHGSRANTFLCGGSVITTRHVLTAAHCIRAVAPGATLSSSLRVTVGTNRWNSGGQTYQLNRFVVHSHYVPSTLKNDIGLLHTSSNIRTSNSVRAIAISYDFVGGGVPVRVAGWGNIRTGGPLSATLNQLTLNTFDGARCVNEVARVAQSLNWGVPRVDPNLEICTFVGVNRGTCNGDSGSPLVRNSNNMQIGVVSWGLACARGAPDMFVRLSAFRAWIQANAR